MSSEGETVEREFDDSVLRPSGHRASVLVVLRGEELGKRYLLNEPSLTVGRDPRRAQIVIADDSVSGRHARIDRHPTTGRYAICDLGSRNGLVVNGERTEFAELTEGDKIAVGGTILKFTSQDELEDKFHVQLDELMNRDSLTGLPVKRLLDAELRKVFRQAADAPLSVLMLDLDELKAINDRHGHQMGARCIEEVGRIVGETVGAGGMASRFGGDEFIAFVRGCSLPQAVALGERIRERVEAHPVVLGDATVYTTLSCGAAERGADVQTPEELVRRADDALYRAKRAGRNRVSS